MPHVAKNITNEITKNTSKDINKPETMIKRNVILNKNEIRNSINSVQDRIKRLKEEQMRKADIDKNFSKT
jgi:hypothetical protein